VDNKEIENVDSYRYILNLPSCHFGPWIKIGNLVQGNKSNVGIEGHGQDMEKQID